jgi:general secretion pathway protein F
MGAFEYTALDTGGREKKGILEGDTPRQVRQLLRERQLLPVTVTEVAQKESKQQQKRSFGTRRGISPADLALFTRQLSTLVGVMPLEEALLAVSQQTEKPRVQSIVMGVRARVMEGHTLANGFADFPRVFPEIYRATVAAGEQTGHLDSVLERLAEYTESREEIRQKILGAMLYPIVLTIMCFGIVSGLLVYVVPKVVSVFETSKAQLPFITRALIGVSDFFRDYGLFFAIGVAAVAFLLARWLRNPGPKRRFHRMQLSLPVIGKLARGFNTARFTRTLSILSGSSVPVLEALRIAGEVITNLPSGESSGELESMLERAAMSQERELDGILTALVGLLGPMLIVLMGLFVMGIVFAMLLPIFEMNSLIR